MTTPTIQPECIGCGKDLEHGSVCHEVVVAFDNGPDEEE